MFCAEYTDGLFLSARSRAMANFSRPLDRLRARANPELVLRRKLRISAHRRRHFRLNVDGISA
jgi:hypothetical protein